MYQTVQTSFSYKSLNITSTWRCHMNSILRKCKQHSKAIWKLLKARLLSLSKQFYDNKDHQTNNHAILAMPQEDGGGTQMNIPQSCTYAIHDIGTTDITVHDMLFSDHTRTPSF